MSSLQSLNSLVEIQSFCEAKYLTLAMFSAPECTSYKDLKIILENAARKYPADEIGFLYIELNENNREVAKFYNIGTLPIIVLFNWYQTITFKTDFETESDVINWLSERIK